MADVQAGEASGRSQRAEVHLVPAVSRVVVGFDGSPGSRDALGWAAGEADRAGASLLIAGACLHPRFGPETRAERAMMQMLQDATDRVASAHPHLEVKDKLFPGLGSEVLIDASHNADLVVVGSRGLGGFRGLLLGSVGQHCLTHAHSTVAIVRHSGDPADRAWIEPRRIVVGIDGSDASADALRWGVAEARRAGAALQVLGSLVVPGEPAYVGVAASFPDAARDLVARTLEEVGRRANDVVVEGAVSEDPPGPSLVEASKGADLVVVGARGLGSFRGLLLGSVRQYAAHHAHCPVVVVRDRSTGSAWLPPGVVSSGRGSRRGSALIGSQPGEPGAQDLGPRALGQGAALAYRS